MSTLELKGGIYDLISTVNDESVLRQLHEMVQDVLEQNMDKTDFWDELTEDQQKAIDEAVEESYDEKNQIPHEEIVKKYQAWLKP